MYFVSMYFIILSTFMAPFGPKLVTIFASPDALEVILVTQ